MEVGFAIAIIHRQSLVIFFETRDCKWWSPASLIEWLIFKPSHNVETTVNVLWMPRDRDVSKSMCLTRYLVKA